MEKILQKQNYSLRRTLRYTNDEAVGTQDAGFLSLCAASLRCGIVQHDGEVPLDVGGLATRLTSRECGFPLEVCGNNASRGCGIAENLPLPEMLRGIPHSIRNDLPV